MEKPPSLKEKFEFYIKQADDRDILGLYMAFHRADLHGMGIRMEQIITRGEKIWSSQNTKEKSSEQ